MNNNPSKFLKKKELKTNHNKFVSFLNKTLLCFIIFTICLILMKNNDEIKSFVWENVYQDNISFAYINNLYNKYFGDILPSYDTNDTKEVFKETLEYKSYNKYYDGYKLEVNNSYLVPIIESGIVVYVNQMDNYGNTVIIEGVDGVDIWYGNIENINVKLYDYVSKGDFLGECNNSLYLVFEKGGEYLDIDAYLKNKI